MAEQKQNQQQQSMGQVKDSEGAHGRRLSEQQDVGELSAQNRGGTTGRGQEKTKRLEQDDREEAAAERGREPLNTTDEEDTCDASAELQELFAEEDRKEAEKKVQAAKEVPGVGNTKADRAEAEALERETESYADEDAEE
jgi:hypothetical protein